MSGPLDEEPSLEYYIINKYRDPAICDKYYDKRLPYIAAYDIYSLGVFLKEIYSLYYYCFKQNEIYKTGIETFEQNFIDSLFP